MFASIVLPVLTTLCVCVFVCYMCLFAPIVFCEPSLKSFVVVHRCVIAVLFSFVCFVYV